MGKVEAVLDTTHCIVNLDTGSIEELPEHDFFHEKSCFMAERFPKVDPYDFYRDIFQEGFLERLGHQEDRKPNGIILELTKKEGDKEDYTGRNVILTDGLEQLSDALNKPYVICSPISYYGRSRKASNALYMHALTLDIDYVGLPQLERLVVWFTEINVVPCPTYIVNSGHGVHLYYVFKEPIPMFKQNQKEIRKLKQRLVEKIWTKHTSTKPEAMEALGVVQGFRMVGSVSKLEGYRVEAYKVGEQVDIDYLNNFVLPEHQAHISEESGLTLHEAAKQFPEWNERVVVRGEKPGRWYADRYLYDWWKRQISDGTTMGHRYFCMMCLAIYAVKCGISYDELESDALDFQKMFTNIGTDPFTVAETYKALEAYNEDYATFPRESIERVSAISIPPNIRHYNNQYDWLQADVVNITIDKEAKERPNPCKINREFVLSRMRANGEIHGRPVGSGTKQEQVQAWRKAHPNGRKIDCQRETGISRPTILKWWDA